MKLWLFGTYKWQGNPKALFIYMNEKCKNTHEVWWIADNEEDAKIIQELGYKATFLNSDISKYLFANADVYVNENFRQSYPDTMKSDITILNLWHGVGIKHIELGLGMTSTLNKDIIKKYIKNANLFTNNTIFLSTSKFMDDHFIKDTLITKDRIVHGPYPRNIVYKNENSTHLQQYSDVKNIDKFEKVLLFAPTYRYKKINGVFSELIPDIDKLQSNLKINNNCMIIKVHPFMTEDPEYKNLVENKYLYPNIILWNDEYDIYEFFSKIDVGIIDYSSIFYDLLESGVKSFIRYIPDYREYTEDSSLIADYFENTEGEIAKSFDDLLSLINKNLNTISDDNEILNKFFEYSKKYSLQDLIKQTDDFKPENKMLPELHTFDIFDTLIKRKTLEPKSVFYKVQREIQKCSLNFPLNLQVEYPKIRHQVEMELRDVYRKTTFERNTDKIEVTLKEVLERLQESYELSNDQVNFLLNAEIDIEINNVEPIKSKINELKKLKEKGHKILLLSDMYLSEETIREKLKRVDLELASLEIFVSSEIGYQKSTGKLFEYIFFNLKPYRFSNWIHHGDNNHADGNVPRSYGINTIIHDIDSFIRFENYLINKTPDLYKWDSYKLVTAMQRYRWSLLDEFNMKFDEDLYYSFSYIGTSFVPYVHWTLEHAIRQGYEDLYFVSRDGYFLKQIADILVEKLRLPINTKYIYGSRKAWRVASYVNEIDKETFTNFGLFSGINNFEELVLSSQLDRKRLLEIVPELAKYEFLELTESRLEEIRSILRSSKIYRKELLEISRDKREIVNQYLLENINFDKKFAFVEFWGRGYTQDTLTRLLENAAQKSIKNPFYYIRNFTPDLGNSIRHRFSVRPANFSYFESIFAQTPYKSISEYEYDKSGKVKPVIIEQDNDFHRFISKGLQDFSKIYADLCKTFENGYEKCISDISYTYQFSHPSDYFITGTFARFKDNVAMYGEVKEFAPEITMDDIEDIGVSNLQLITRNIPMSATRSSNKVREFINKKLNKNYPPRKAPFVVNDLTRYIGNVEYPAYMCSLKDQAIYENVNWSNNSKNSRRVKKGEIVKVYGLEWGHTGVPRLKIHNGYITASKEYVSHLTEFKYLWTNTEQTIYNKPDLVDQIGEIKKNERVKVLEVIDSEDMEKILFTTNGYISLDEKKLYVKADEMKKREVSNFYLTLLGKKIIFNNNLVGYDKLNEPDCKKKLINKNKVHSVTSVVEDNEGIPYLLLNDVFVRPTVDEVIELNKNYRKYIYNKTVPFIELKQDVYMFNSIEFNDKNKVPKKLKRFSTYEIEDIVWHDNGVPRIKIKDGYISANKKFIFAKNKARKYRYLPKKIYYKLKISRLVK